MSHLEVGSATIRWAGAHLDDARRAASIALLSAAELERLGRAASPESFLAGRMLLRELAAELTGSPVAEIVITATCPDCGGAHGAPRVAGLHLSLTHTPDTVVAAASRNAAVGVDAEPASGGATRARDIGALTGVPSLRHWTRVEAVLKADGRGLRVDPASVTVDEDGTARIAGSPTVYHVHDLSIAPSVVASLAIAL